MELALAPDRVAEADYWPGAADMPAVLILHGFLQTREFPAVRRLAEALADEGYSVLTPTLSLGLNRRRQSLACEAIHTHTLQQDVAELSTWARWLAGRAGKAPVVIGQGVGGIQVAAMLDAREAPVDRALLVGTKAFRQGPSGAADIGGPADAVATGDADSIGFYRLGYCSRYASTAIASSSYLAWDRDRLQRMLLAVEAPVTLISGGEEVRVGTDWIRAPEAAGVELRTIPGADHFLDLAHASELLDEVLKVIMETNRG
jgi:pimeloyl-ACP methyl ester carboxylesterase